MNLPMPAPTAPATTSEQFARAVRNAALADFDRDLKAALDGWSRVGPLHQPAMFLDVALDALERCVAQLARADRFAPDDAAPAGGVVVIRGTLLR